MASQAGVIPSESEINDHSITEYLCWKVSNVDNRLIISLIGLGALLALGVIGFVVKALTHGFSDSARGEWGYYAAMFGFLLATGGTAPLVAVALRWTKNHWRRPLSRASEMFALVGLLNFLWFIPLMLLLPAIDLNGDGLLEVGQDRRTIWFETPIGAPLVWDALALGFLVICGLAILWVSARPDIYLVSQRVKGWRATVLGRLAGGWHWTEKDWQRQQAHLAVLGALYFMLLIFVHTLISLDFALSLVPGWKDSIFAAHHALTGIQAASGMVVVTLFLMHRFAGFKNYIGMETFWSFSKILLGLTLLWAYFWFSQFMTFWYGRIPVEISVIKLTMFESYRTVFLLNVFFSFLLPFFLLLWNGIRRSIIGPTIAAVSVVVGAFFMMVRTYVPAFNIPHEDLGAHAISDSHVFHAEAGGIATQLLPVMPDIWDIFMILGGLGSIAIIFLLGAKLIPVISIWETKQGLMYAVFKPFMKGRYLILGKPE